MIERNVSDKLSFVCSNFIGKGCILSHCPLAKYMCYSFRSPNEMYEQLAPNVRRKVDAMLDEYKVKVVVTDDNET